MHRSLYKEFQNQLLRWYRQQARRLPWRATDDPYAIWVSEVMLQQTQVKTVLLYFDKFIQRFPDVRALARADLTDVLKLWEGMGYYARARNLHRAAGIVVTEHNARIPSTRRQFQKLPGVGDYIAAAVLSIAFNQVEPVIDGNVKRVLARLFEIDAPVNRSASYRRFHQIATELIPSKHPGDFNQAMMELGALVCTPANPRCPECPANRMCRANAHHSVDRFPRKIKPRPVPQIPMAIGVVFRNDRVLITRRPPKGLLGGLWEFPGGEVNAKEPPETACVRIIKQTTNLSVTVDSFLTKISHAYTHFKIKADVFICTHQRGSVILQHAIDHRWIGLDALDDYPFPKANHKFFKPLKAMLAGQPRSTDLKR